MLNYFSTFGPSNVERSLTKPYSALIGSCVHMNAEEDGSMVRKTELCSHLGLWLDSTRSNAWKRQNLANCKHIIN